MGWSSSRGAAKQSCGIAEWIMKQWSNSLRGEGPAAHNPLKNKQATRAAASIKLIHKLSLIGGLLCLTALAAWCSACWMGQRSLINFISFQEIPLINSLHSTALIVNWNCSISLPFLFVFSFWRSPWRLAAAHNPPKERGANPSKKSNYAASALH